jgi:uncharacterized FAD-dependent dehydrogenase
MPAEQATEKGSVRLRDGWDAVIVGAGPAGLFAARELALHPQLRVLVLEMGPDLPTRLADPSLRTSGFGGAGAFSDGKLTLSPNYGGQLVSRVRD